MRITLNEAKKLLCKLQSDKDFLLRKIDDLSVYIAAVSENAEDVRPDFNLEEIVAEIEAIDKKIIKIHCARNRANNEIMLKTSGMSVMEALIKLPVLNKELKKWESLAIRQKKTRVNNSYGNNKEIEYEYTNYSLEFAKDKFKQTQDEIIHIQSELDMINVTEFIEIEI